MNKTPTKPRIVWLASYPRSGNSWLRFLIANLLVKDIRTSRQVELMIPELGADAGGRLALSPRHRSLVATHWPYSPDNDLFGLTAGFIYVVRNPRDVMRSLFDFNLTELVPHGGAASEGERASAWAGYVRDFVDRRGHPVRGRADAVADWTRHVESWRRAAGTVPGLFVRYEDLLSDTKREMQRICTFLRAAPDAAVLDAAIAKSTFAAMKAMEDREVAAKSSGIFYRPAHAALSAKGIRVMSRGADADTVLTADQTKMFLSVFGAAMAALGYTIDPGSGRLTVADTALGEDTVLPPGPDLAAPRVGVAAPQPAMPSDLLNP